jgi:hypothetical protein
MSEPSASRALEVIDRAHVQRRALDAAEAAAWVEFAVGYDSLGGRRVGYAGEGTPAVDEFVALELAAAVRRREASVRVQLEELLDLAFRLPRLWELVGAARVPVWVGRMVARHTRALSSELAGWVDATLAPFAERLGTGRLEEFCVALVAQADPVRAAAARERAKNWRGVEIVPTSDQAEGVRQLHGLLDTADAVSLDAALEQLAGILVRQGAGDPHSQLRATALGILATPARALALIQQDLTQPSFVEAPDTDNDTDSDSDVGGRGPGGCAGDACGTITVDPDRLLPHATLVVHLSDQAIGDPHGICRVEGVGPVPVGQLHDMVGHTRVRVLPVFDPDGVVPVDSYEIPLPVRRAVLLRHPFELFPYSSNSNAGCDLDHTDPWRADGPPGQTRPDNLGPFRRRPHRAKTHAGWRLRTPAPGVFVWTTPLGRIYTLTPDGLTHTGPPPEGWRKPAAARPPEPGPPGDPPPMLFPDLPAA